MSEKIEPALTPEEWESGHIWRGKHMVEGRYNARRMDATSFTVRLNAGGGTPDRVSAEFSDTDVHAIAALALYGQPFGFRPEVVGALRRLKRHCDTSIEIINHTTGETVVIDSLLDYVAERIEALLPEAK